MSTTEALDRDLRLLVYRHIVDEGAPPTAAQAAEALGRPTAEAEDALRRLEAGRVLVLAPGTANVWMANPFSAVPTDFRVTSASGSWWANCVWDAFGIPAVLGEDAVISTHCADCGEALDLAVRGDSLEPAEGVAHFAVPARRWWENIGYT